MGGMKISEAVKKAVTENDAVLAGQCADQLRSKCRMTYAQVLAFAQAQVPGLTPEHWEGLMYEADIAG